MRDGPKESLRARLFFNRLRCSFYCEVHVSLSYLYPQFENMIHFIYFNSCHFHHRVYYELTIACFPVGLISAMDRTLRPVIAKGLGSTPGQD